MLSLMSMIAIVGTCIQLAGAIARRFGAEGSAVALIAPGGPGGWDGLAANLRSVGVSASTFAVERRDPFVVQRALAEAAAELGEVGVMIYSPPPSRSHLRSVLDTTAEELREATDAFIHHSCVAVHMVLPAMRAAGRGTLLFVNDENRIRPMFGHAGTSVGFAGQAAYVAMLHETLTEEGIHAAQLVYGGGSQDHNLHNIAENLWRMHTDRGDWRVINFEPTRIELLQEP